MSEGFIRGGYVSKWGLSNSVSRIAAFVVRLSTERTAALTALLACLFLCASVGDLLDPRHGPPVARQEPAGDA